MVLKLPAGHAHADWAQGVQEAKQLIGVLQQCAKLKNPNRGPTLALIEVIDKVSEKRQLPSQADLDSLEDLNKNQAYCGILFDMILKNADSFMDSAKKNMTEFSD